MAIFFIYTRYKSVRLGKKMLNTIVFGKNEKSLLPRRLDGGRNKNYNLRMLMKPLLSVDKFEKSCGAKMSDSVSDEVLQNRMLEVAFKDIKEPEYQHHEVVYSENDEDEVYPMTNYYDANGILRKIEYHYHTSITSIDLYDKDGNLDKQIKLYRPMRTDENPFLKVFDEKANSCCSREFSRDGKTIIETKNMQFD